MLEGWYGYGQSDGYSRGLWPRKKRLSEASSGIETHNRRNVNVVSSLQRAQRGVEEVPRARRHRPGLSRFRRGPTLLFQAALS